MIKTLYDPVVEKRGMEKGIVAKGTGLSIDKVIKLKKEMLN